MKKHTTNSERRWFFAKVAASVASVPVIAKGLSLLPSPRKRPVQASSSVNVSINPHAVPRTNKDQA
ncbi:MAG: hypothetical protein MUF82_08100 [Bacteroidetes bacterium]|jgi:hypothetical protein|nr:hypothetical protein [Bacteroidota bacterium]